MRKILFLAASFIIFLATTAGAQTQPTYPHYHFPGKGGMPVSPDPLNTVPDKGDNTPGRLSSGQSGTGANINVVYHRINWTIDPNGATKTITGTVVTYFKTLVANVSSITLDLNTSSFNNGSLSVTYHGTTCTKACASNILTITLPSTIVAANTLDSMVVNYSGIPPAVNGAAEGYQAGGATTNKYTMSLSESYEDRDWWPCKADMQDKIDSMDIIVTVPWNVGAADTFWVASNGKLMDSAISGSNRTFWYKTRYPIPSYLVAVSVAKFTRYYRVVNVNGTNVQVAYYLLRNTANQSTITTAMDKINLVLTAFSAKFGDYPFKLEKHGFYDGLLGAGGMEHQTFSGIANNALTDLQTLAHELMHQWFGDNVSFSTWNDLWLAEGFARYSESLCGELVPSLGLNPYTIRDGFKTTALGLAGSAWIPNASMTTSNLVWGNPYGSTVYERGCMVVSMLRSICGDTKFYQALTNYQTARAGKSATTDTLKNYFNAVLGQDISQFFTDYVGGSGSAASASGGVGNPINPVNWNSPAANKLVIQMGTQTRTGGSNVTYFHGPVVVHFANGPAGSWTKDTTIVFYDWGGGSLSYAGNGLSDPIPGNILNYNLSFTPTNAFYDDSARTMSTGSVTKVGALTGYTWTGTTNAAWNTTTNWSNSTVAPSGAQVTVATTGSQPVLPGTITVGGLFLNAGTTLNIGNNTLIINGTITGTGTLTGSTSSNITINNAAGTLNFDQTSAATRSLNNLTISTGSSATLGSALDVYGTIAVNSSTLDLNGKNLTLKSNASGTARIADLTGSTLANATNVTVERYIPNDGRRYRLLAPTVNSTGSIKTNWMEGQMNSAIGTNINTIPGYGTQITGSLGNTNGFDKTTSNAPSLYLTNNGASLTYAAVTSTAGTLNAKTGYFLFTRGDRSVDMTSTAPVLPSSATTLRTTGTLVTGTQTSFTNALVGNSGFSLLTNPYASPIDWSLVNPSCTGVTNFYTLWDPNNGTRGGFVTVSTAGVASAGLATKYIQGGQAFFVQASGAAIPTVSIQESHKAAGNNNGIFTPTAIPQSFSAGIYFYQADSTRKLADGTVTIYDNNYNAGIDDNDADEINNWDENIAIDRLGHHLSIEGRPIIVAVDTIPLFMNNMKQRGYEWEFTATNFSNPGLQGTLIDNFTGTRSAISVTNTTVIPFTVTADPLSAAPNRFMVVFGAQGPLPITISSVRAYQKNPGIEVEWVMQGETDMDRYEVERSADGSSFSKVATVASLGNSSQAVNYNWFDASPLPGNNFYRIKSIDKAGKIKYSTIVKVSISKGIEGITVYPNPVNGNDFGLQLNNMAKGTYTITLTNKLGQQVYATSLEHAGGSATITIETKYNLPNGVYDLQVNGLGQKMNSKVVKE